MKRPSEDKESLRPLRMLLEPVLAGFCLFLIGVLITLLIISFL